MEDLIEALQIFLKYGNLHYPTEVGYQELYIRGIEPDAVSVEDTARLSELGFFVREGDKCFESYRFGTC